MGSTGEPAAEIVLVRRVDVHVDELSRLELLSV
jgi:hypothetical protein